MTEKEAQIQEMSEEDKQRWAHWGSKLSFTLEEGILLKHGCLPPDHLNPEESSTYRLVYTVAIEMGGHLDLMHSSLRIDKTVGKEWEMLSPEDALKKVISRQTFDEHWKKFARQPIKNIGDEVNPREQDSMLRMIVGMAMKHYNYNPFAERTNATTKIKLTLEEYGVDLDDTSILKFLRKGAELVPNYIKERFKA